MDGPRLDKFVSQLKMTFNNKNEFHIYDQLITKSFALFRVFVKKEILDEILEFKEIAFVDRPPTASIKPYEYKNIALEELKIEAPDDNAVGVLVVDSGVVANHPLIKLAYVYGDNYQEGEIESNDTVGHGNAVSGCVLYGDVDKCINEKNFKPANKLYSAKIMYKHECNPGEYQAIFDPQRLLESQLEEAIEDFLDKDEFNIKVVNLSIGNFDEVWYLKRRHQFPLASLIDDLAYKYPNVVFIISAGNKTPLKDFSLQEIIDNYPNYLIDDENYRIINPATAALALTVGSIAPEENIADIGLFDSAILRPIAQNNQPSPFTRTGFGVNNMIKPELVEYGGNDILGSAGKHIIENIGGKLTLISNRIDELFTKDNGTSFSAAKISYLVSRIAQQFPDRSANFIKNLVLQSTSLPDDPFDKCNNNNLLRTVGYGLPDYDKAMNSYEKRVLLWHEGELGLNSVALFSFAIPDKFCTSKISLSVVLTFNPETRATRGDSYLGNKMEFHLFHKSDPDIILKHYANIDIANSDEIKTPDKLSKNEIGLDFKSYRKNGCHQKGYKRLPRKELTSPLSLVVINSNKWIKDDKYIQSFCLSVVLSVEEEVEEKIDIYTSLRNEVVQKLRLRQSQ